MFNLNPNVPPADLQGAFALLAVIADPKAAKAMLDKIALELKAVQETRDASQQASDRAKADELSATKKLAEADLARVKAEELSSKNQELLDGLTNAKEASRVAKEEAEQASSAVKAQSVEFAKQADVKTRELQAREEAVAHREREAVEAALAARALRAEYEEKLEKLRATIG